MEVKPEMAHKFSKTEIKQMQLAFAQTFSVSKEVSEHAKIREWMESAPTGIVEWEGTFHHENPKSRDYRMKMAEVYEGDIHHLVEYLRDIFEEHAELTKWALIFKVYSGIKDCGSLIQAVDTTILLDGGTGESGTTQADEPTTSSDSSAENKTQEDTIKSGPERRTDVEENSGDSGKLDSSAANDLLSNTPVITGHKEELSMADEKEVFEQTAQTTGATTGTGAAPATSTGNAELDALMSAASAAAPEAGVNLDATQNPGIAGQVAGKVAMPTIGSTYIDNAQRFLEQDLPRRVEWGKSNMVTRIITKAEPSSMRMIGNTGVIGTGEEPQRKKTVEAIMTKFAKAVGQPSWSAMTDEQTLDQRFPHVTGIGDQQRAEAVRQVLLKLYADPMAELQVYVNPKPTWSVNGVELNGTDKLSMAEFRDRAIADCPGAVYAKGSLVEGAPISEPTAFVLTMVKGKQATKNASGSKPHSGKTEGAVGVWAGQMRVANKAKFVEQTANLLIIFPTVKNPTQEQQKYVGAKALVSVDGKDVAASFKYEVYKEDGTPEYIVTDKRDKDGNPVAPKKKTRTFNLNVRTLVALTESTPVAEIGDAKKYNVSPVGAAKEMKDYTDIEQLKKDLYGRKDKNDETKTVDNSEAALVRLLAASAAGVTNMKIDEKSTAAATINKIKATVANAEAAKDARDAADLI